MVVKLQKVGNSMMVVIPSYLVKDLGLNAGDEMSVEGERGNKTLKVRAITKNKYKLNDFVGSISIPNFNFEDVEKVLEEEYGR